MKKLIVFSVLALITTACGNGNPAPATTPTSEITDTTGTTTDTTTDTTTAIGDTTAVK